MNSKKLLRIGVTAVLVLVALAIFTAGASAEDYTFVTEWGGNYFNHLTAMTLDSSGNVYVADTNNHRIQKFAPAIPSLSFSPSSHDFGDMHEGDTDSTTFEVRNSGTGTFTYSLSESGSWVEVNPTSGSSTGEHDTITVDIDTTGLAEGYRTCDISISSDGGSGTFIAKVNVVSLPNCTCGDICVIPTGWWRDGGAFQPTDTPIQSAVDNATAGETICVKDGTYTENVDVDTPLTIKSENGAASTTVNALYSNDHVFEVTADYVTLSGFTVNGAIGSWKAGIYLDRNIGHCNIYDNNASGNYVGIYMTGSSNYNTITGNTASNNHNGIYLSQSSNNTISGNTALNNYCGIYLFYSSSNTIADNTASNNDNGIRLFQSSNNRIYNNYFNNKNNARDDGSNIWNIAKTAGTNIIGGSWLGGNYWSDYAGIDANGDGLGDTLLPYNANGDILVGGDLHPLVAAGIAPLLSVEKTDHPDPVQAGGALNYSISVSNKGYIYASAVTVTEIYDVNVTFESAIPAPSLGNDMWIFPALNANETKLINISVTVNPLTAIGTVLHNTVTVSCAEGVTDADTEATTVFSGEPNCTCGDICVIPTGWWRDGGAFHPTDTPIQSAVDNATAGETICVKDGTYTENVDVDTPLTIRSENCAGSTTVNALYSNDHVFEVTVDYVSISGFTVNGATGSWKAGIYLDRNIGHCNIYDNNASSNYVGIYMTGSSNYNTITGNTASNNHNGIYLSQSSNNTISGNTALNNYCGIYLFYSSSNTIADNTASNNDNGIRLFQSSNNRIYNNYFNNKNNAQDDGTNIWNIAKTAGTNIIGGSWLGGNYWSDYAGIDANGDGLGDTLLPYNANGDILVGGDLHPLVAAGIAPLLSVEKTDHPDPVQAGGALNYSISVSNKGYIYASAVTVTEIYDVNVTFESAIPAPSLGNDMWIFPALNANETKLINISVTVNPLTAIGTVLHNTVTVSCAEGVTDADTEATTVFSGEPNCTCGDICVIPTGWWRDGGAFHPTDTPIQSAVDNATAGETICVKDGTYTENVDVDTPLTIRSENGAGSTTVNALYSNDHVFEVTVDYVSISGFTVNGATGSWKAGIYLDRNIGHCNIYDNNASSNYVGIYMTGSSNYNTITGNTASNNHNGIYLSQSRNNTISGNTALNNYCGIYLFYSSSNTIADNTASNNDNGIRLFQSSNNRIYNNYFNNKNNARDDGSNIWNIAKTAGTNIIGGSWLGGNYWSDYAGIDTNGDGLGDTLLPYNANGAILVGGDMHPLVPAGIAPLLSLEKTDDPDPVQAGGTLNYSISVSNKGYVYASAVTVTEIYDVNVTFDSAIPAPSLGNDMWIFPTLNANETKLINISVTVNPLTAMGSVLHNTVTVSCAEGVTDTDTEATTVFSEGLNCTCGDICINETGWWRDGGAFHPTDTPIQAAIDNATAGETICVKDGTYTENMDVNKQLTIRSENGAEATIVQAANPNDNVFEVTADHVNIHGFSVQDATDKTGIYLYDADYCNIFDNKASNNAFGIFIESSSDCTVTNNIAFNYNSGIVLNSSSDCTVTSNTAFDNGFAGFGMGYSSNCMLNSNTAFNNELFGIGLWFSSNNTLTSNNVSNNILDDFRSADSHGNVVTDLTIASYPTKVSFTYDDVGLKGVDTAPSDPEGKVNINKYVNVTGYSADSWISLNVNYRDCDLDGVDETSLRMWKYDGTWTEVPPPNGVNTAENYVYANISSFSIFAPLGNSPGTQTSIAITTDKYEYTPGDIMTITVDIENPTASSVDTYFVWLLRLPEYIYQKPMLVTRLTLPPYFDQTYNNDIYVGNWATIGVNAEWYVALLETSTPYDIICDDTAEWRYDPDPDLVSSRDKGTSKGGSVPPEEVVPEQIADAIRKSIIGEIALPVEQVQEEEITEEILDAILKRHDDTVEWPFDWLPAP